MAHFSRLAAATGGASAIEFALVAAFLMLPLTVGLYDFGTALYSWMEVGNAARAGAQYVNVNGYSSLYTTTGNSCPSPQPTTPSASGFTCAAQGATNLSGVTVWVHNVRCGCQSGTTSFAAPSSSPPCNSCSAVNQTPVTLVDVSATYDYAPIFNYLGFGPSNGFNIGVQATALIY